MSRHACVTDYNSDEGEIPTSRQANMARKRSDTLAKDAPVVTDRSSDSGYSCRTHLTSASADSTKSIKVDQASTVTSEIHTIDSSCKDEELGSSKDKKKSGRKCSDPNCPKRHKSKSSKIKAESPPESSKSKSKSKSRDPSTSSKTKEKREKKDKAAPPPSPRQPSSSSSAPRQRSQTRDSQREEPRQRPRSQSVDPRTRQPPPPFFAMQPPPPGPPVSYVTRSRYPRAYDNQPVIMIPGGGPNRPHVPPVSPNLSARTTYGSPILDQSPAPRLSARTPTEPGFLQADPFYRDELDRDLEDDEEDSEPEYEHVPNAISDYQGLMHRTQEAQAKKFRDAMNMPPPQRPANKKGLSMRNTNPTRNPVISYDQETLPYEDMLSGMGSIDLERPGVHPLGPNSRMSRTQHLVPREMHMDHSNSYYDGQSNAELQMQHEANRTRYLANRRLQPEPDWIDDAESAHAQMLDREMRRRENMAESHINYARSQGSSIHSQSLLAEDSSSRRSKRSSKDSSPNPRGRRESNTSLSQAEDDAFRMRLEPGQTYNFNVNGPISVRHDSEGAPELIINGQKRETVYPATTSGSAAGSRIGRRTSIRASRYDGESILEGEESQSSASRRRRPSRDNEPPVDSYGRPIGPNKRHSYTGHYPPQSPHMRYDNYYPA